MARFMPSRWILAFTWYSLTKGTGKIGHHDVGRVIFTRRRPAAGTGTCRRLEDQRRITVTAARSRWTGMRTELRGYSSGHCLMKPWFSREIHAGDGSFTNTGDTNQ